MKKPILKQNRLFVLAMAAAIVMVFSFCPDLRPALAQEKGVAGEVIKLPPPKLDGNVSVEKALQERRSIRSYKEEPVTLAEVSQIVWAAQGITEPTKGLRTSPSARAQYFLEIYVLPGNVTGLPMGLYKYRPQGHELVLIADGDKKADLFKAAGQAPIKNAPVALVFTGLSEKAKQRPSWMYVEAGHAAQNVYLQAVSLNLGTVVIGGFKEEAVAKALRLPEKEVPIYIMPVGKK
jgi:SagB-type dehydrogenase family enzyme